jgi:hypothetical protein
LSWLKVWRRLTSWPMGWRKSSAKNYNRHWRFAWARNLES